MRKKIIMRRGNSIALFTALFTTVHTTAFASTCSEDVKQALTDSSWTLTTEYSARTRSVPVKTRVAADGTMEVIARRNKVSKITCDGKEIVFDYQNDFDQRYTLTLGNDGVFNGSRPGHGGPDYNATLTKIENRSTKRSRKTASVREGGSNPIPTVRPVSGAYEVAQGGKVVIYSIAGAGCDSKPPTFEEAISINARSGGANANPEGGKLYDAGVARYRSRKCGGWVMSRAIGFQANSNFTGALDLKFGRRNVEITVK